MPQIIRYTIANKQKTQITLDDLRRHDLLNALTDDPLAVGGALAPQQKGILDPRLPLFNYTTETVNMLLMPMIKNKKEALGSMGNDAPLACLSRFQPLPYEYFKQLFAQVTNPPIDPFREKIVMSLQCPIGPEDNLLHPSAEQTHRLWISNPILSRTDLAILKRTTFKGWSSKVIDITFPYGDGVAGYDHALKRVCQEGQLAAEQNNQVLVLSDRLASKERCPLSALLAIGALHHHLIETRNRMKVALIVETAEINEVHHVCVILGYGADAICPYLAFELAGALRDEGVLDHSISDQQIYSAYAQAIDTGISKVMAKMGISTLQSYKSECVSCCLSLSLSIIASPTKLDMISPNTFETSNNFR